MEEKENELLTKVASLFMQFGIKSMTMDDISTKLGVSKKTLYQFVEDKNALVTKVMKLITEIEKRQIDQLSVEFPNAIDMVFAMSKGVAQKYGEMHPSINYDLQKYYPAAWTILQSFQRNYVAESVIKNIQNGIAQGLYRENLDPFLIANFYSSKLHMCTDGVTFPSDKYSFQKIYLEMIRYHIRGIASEKGIEYLKEKVKQENLNL